MKHAAVVAALFAVTAAQAAPNLEAGKARVAAVCAACHGAAGVSVSDGIPNLAAQKAAYLETQLKALKDGTRKNVIMNAMASQLLFYTAMQRDAGWGKDILDMLRKDDWHYAVFTLDKVSYTFTLRELAAAKPVAAKPAGMRPERTY